MPGGVRGQGRRLPFLLDPIQQALLDIDELHSFTDLSTFAQHIPVERIESALHLPSQAPSDIAGSPVSRCSGGAVQK
jgi:hypothetical protein